jgi:hypothetical protein
MQLQRKRSYWKVIRFLLARADAGNAPAVSLVDDARDIVIQDGL